jgi:hypothetical protein
VTAKEVVLMAHRMGKPSYDAKYDLNADGKVSVSDLHIVIHCMQDEHRAAHGHEPKGGPHEDD